MTYQIVANILQDIYKEAAHIEEILEKSMSHLQSVGESAKNVKENAENTLEQSQLYQT